VLSYGFGLGVEGWFRLWSVGAGGVPGVGLARLLRLLVLVCFWEETLVAELCERLVDLFA
jgi:hypothetical protein